MEKQKEDDVEFFKYLEVLEEQINHKKEELKKAIKHNEETKKSISSISTDLRHSEVEINHLTHLLD